jgi:outer membrane protein OmpA-like peptidoglycan-associated protein
MKKLLTCLMVLMMAIGLSACAWKPTVNWVKDCCVVTVIGDNSENVVINENIMFDWDNDLIRADQQEKINLIAYTMLEYPELTLKLNGHASTEGDIDYNFDLSNRRANAVRDALVAKGVSLDRIVNVQGMGETDIFGIELSPNRRVEVSSE